MSGPNADLTMPVEAVAEDEDDSFGEAEYAAINSMLDQINSCLDHLEEKNDHLHARIQELLESSRQTRLEFQQQFGEDPSDASP
ncbi:bublin coiled-coil protein [Eulemur rufifrons]|uniref:bublin coiled-coil protein n=1 Tax=Eulemur rufifrons TaxID=859984 RepID=UPI003744188D